MKKLLLLMIVLVFTNKIQGQDGLKIFKLDFKTKRFNDIEKLEYLKKGDFYQLQIDGINLNLYKVIINVKDTIVTSNLTFPTFDLASLGGIGDLLAKIDFSAISTSNFTSGSSANKTAQEILSDKKLSLGKQSFSLEEISNKGFKELSTAWNPNDAQAIKELFEKRINKGKKEIQKSDNLLNSYRHKIDEVQLSIQYKIFSYLVLNNPNPLFQGLSVNLKIDSILKQIDTLRKEIKYLSISIMKQQSEYSEFTSTENIIKVLKDEKNKDLIEADKKLAEAFVVSLNNAEKLYDGISSEKVSGWIKEIIYKENNSNSSYTSLPQQLKEDQTKFNIQIIPAKEEYGLPTYKTEIQFPHLKKFYVGIGMSFFYAGLRNDAFSTKATVVNDSITNYQIIDEKVKRGELGLATLIHFGWRPYYDKERDWLGVNLVTGPALSFSNNAKPRIILGAGVAFGRENMLTINGILIGGFVERKSKVYNPGETYSISPDKVTVSKLAGSFGISFGYIYKF
jgi:hypothetical protein